MIVTIIDVGQPTTTKTARGGYQTIEVSYKNDRGDVQGKKIMSFANPQVYKDVQTFKKGDVVEVETVKDDKGYWQWKNIKVAGASGASEPAKGGRVVGSNYETAEERARRQVYIVRQSSLANALTFLQSATKKADLQEVLNVAKQFETYVFEDSAPVEEADVL